MKRIAYLLLPLLLAACTQRPDRVELTDWQFEYHGQQYAATVPGFIHTDLMANGLIPDPYYGTNEDSVQWVGDSVWHYSTTIRKSELPEGDTLWLVFEGLAGQASIVINGEFPGVPADRKLAESTRYTLEYIAASPVEKLYTFTVKEEVLGELQQIAREYMGRIVGHKFKSLEILETLC